MKAHRIKGTFRPEVVAQLKGDKGDPGERGVQGIAGADGTQGLRGEQGIQGYPGAPGEQGIQGLPGADGAQGEQGIQGIQGVPGAPGVDGEDGIQGIPGNDGAPGAKGDKGDQGDQGIQGIQGVPGAPGGVQTLKKTADQIVNGTAFQNITGLTFAVLANTDYAFDFYITFRSAATTTGFRFSVNAPAGVVDFFMTYQTIANSETAGVATWLQKHSVTFDAMTVTTATITANVDLHCRITGRYKCGGSGGTFAARAASELANNDLVIQKGSWGTYF